jgi:hypothetical protein
MKTTQDTCTGSDTVYYRYSGKPTTPKLKKLGMWACGCCGKLNSDAAFVCCGCGEKKFII